MVSNVTSTAKLIFSISFSIALVWPRYTKRGWSWDPPAWTPDNEGWRALMNRREAQLYSVDAAQERWDGKRTSV